GGLKYHETAVVIVPSGNPQSREFHIAPYKKGTWRTYKARDGLPHNMIFKIDPDPQTGTLWLATRAGVSHFDGKDFQNFTITDGLSDSTALSLMREPTGEFWVGTEAQGAVRYDPRTKKATKKLSKANGLTNDTIWSLARDSSGGMWFGGEAGPSRY